MVIVPHRQSVTETVARIRSICPRAKGIAVQSLISSSEFDSFATAKRMIAVTTPSACLRIDDSAMVQHVNRLALFVLEDLHLFDDQYEIAVARILSMARPARTRIVGITSSLNDPSDLADWLGVGAQSRFFFHPRDRGNPVVVSLKTFTIAHSSTLLKVMVKPAYDILKSATDGAILFVPSRAACRTVAADLITQSGTEMDLDGFLAAPRDDVEPMVQRLRDPSLFEPVLHGIGFILPGMAPNDLSTVLELFASGILRALIVPREACWTLPVRAEAVVVMGAQYIQTTGGQDRGDRQVVNYSRQELVKMQGFAVRSAHQTSTGGRLFIMCQSEQATAISRVFNDGLPLESSLPALIRRQSSHEAISALAGILKHRQPPPPPQLSRPRVPDLRKRDMMDMIGWTYLARRIKSNPTYYDMHRGTEGEELSRLVDEWFKGLPDEYGPISVASSVSGSRTGSKMGSKKGSKTDSVAMSRDGSSSSGKGMVHGHATRAGDISDGMEMDKQVDGKAAVAEADGEPFGSTRGSCGMRSVPRGDLG